MLNLLTAASVVAAASAASLKGFNYGSTDSSGAVQDQSAFETLFTTAQGLDGVTGFNSARLYTTIQGGTASDPIAAIPAAISTKTQLLLGLWCSGGDEQFNNEITALKAAIQQYGSEFGDLVVGISVGSEDLYRDSVPGYQANAGIGTTPDVIVNYIKTLRSTISGTALANVPVGHVDTWTAWVNGSNAEVIDNVDWVGFDGYPYFQNTMANSIDDAKSLFYDSYDKTKAAAGSKEVWITETGWPTSGKTENLGVASVDNAKTYWDEVGCELFGSVNTFWYTLFDGTSSPSFGLVGSTLSTTPLFDLSCSANTTSSSSVASSSSTSAVSSSAAASSTVESTTESSEAPASTTSEAAPTSTEVAPTSTEAPSTTNAPATTEAPATTAPASTAPTETSSATSTATTAIPNGATGIFSGKAASLAALVAVFAAFM